MIGKIWKKSRLYSEMIWKIWKKSKLKSEKIWKIWNSLFLLETMQVGIKFTISFI